MDPLSITAAVVSFLDAGFRLKASIDKVNTNRRRLRELTDDLVVVLTAVKTFCHENEISLRGAPFAELSSSMNQLTRTLLHLCDQAERMDSVHKRMNILKPGAAIAAWRDAGSLETQLIRLREKIQTSLNQAQLLISARTEVVLARLEHEVLISHADARVHFRQLDDLFCESLCAPDSKFSTISFLHVSELDNLTLPYVRLKLRNIQQLWADWPRILAITPGTHSSVHPQAYTPMPPSLHALAFTAVVKRLSEIWQVISVAGIAPVSLDPIFIIDFVDDLLWYGLPDIAFDVYDCFVRDLRRSIQASDSQQVSDELLLWLSFALQRQYEASFKSNSSLPAMAFVQEALEVFLTLSPDATSVYSASAQIWRQADLLVSCALAGIRFHDYEAAFSYAQRALDIILPNYQLRNPTRAIRSSLAQWTIQDALVAYSCVEPLCVYATAHAKLGQYSHAYHFGVDALSLLWGIRSRRDLPPDFQHGDNLRVWLEGQLPLWVSIVHNPSARVSNPVGWSGSISRTSIEDSDGNDCIEWGIAI